jgi:hypothetical protein
MKIKNDEVRPVGTLHAHSSSLKIYRSSYSTLNAFNIVWYSLRKDLLPGYAIECMCLQFLAQDIRRFKILLDLLHEMFLQNMP